MSFPPKPTADSGSETPSGEKKGLGLALSGNPVMNIQEIAKIPFDVTVFNDGISYNLATREVTVADAGKLVFTASIGAEPVGTGFVITAFLYKNGLPIRQKASELVNNAPYAIANISIVDKCAAGDVYELYATANATGVTTYAITSDNGVSGFEMAYL